MKKEREMTRKAVYIASTNELSGKSAVTIALALLAKQAGEKVGYFKPIGLASAVSEKGESFDEDVQTMKNILSLSVSDEQICPFTLRKDEFLEDLENLSKVNCIEKVTNFYREAAEKKDIMLIEGASSLSNGSFFGCSVPKLAVQFNAEILLVETLKEGLVVDDVLQARDYCAKWEAKLLGVVLNRVPRNKTAKVAQVIKPLLEKNGINVLGLIPEDSIISALTVEEIYAVIGGKILAGKEGMDRTVQTVLIGAMTPESAVKYFHKAKNNLIITGGDRTDIIFAALETGTSALILTGNLYPSAKIFPRADELEVPIILVPYDTYTTLQMVQKIVGKIKPTDKRRITRAKKLVEENVDWKRILSIERP